MIWHGVREKGIYRGVRVECRFPDNSGAILSVFLSLSPLDIARWLRMGELVT